MISVARETLVEDPLARAEQIVNGLPHPDDFASHRQPVYPDRAHLVDTVANLCITDAVTTAENVDALKADLQAIGEGSSDKPFVIMGGCNEVVDVTMPIDDLVAIARSPIHILGNSNLRQAVYAGRDRGQDVKPRTKLQQILANGQVVTPHMGLGVNGVDIDDRTPDASRMMSSAVQARDLEVKLTEAEDGHIYAAHEALLLAREKPFIRNGYLLSTDIPWTGLRTNDPYGEHIDMLKDVENPVGVKVGPTTTPDQLAQILETLNPNQAPGKVVLMYRLGLENIHKLRPLLRIAKDRDPDAVHGWDIHGDVDEIDGKKIRAVSKMLRSIRATALICQDEGVNLRHLHLETVPDSTRLECVDNEGELPTHPGDLDPRLNPRQTMRILNGAAPYLALKAA